MDGLYVGEPLGKGLQVSIASCLYALLPSCHALVYHHAIPCIFCESLSLLVMQKAFLQERIYLFMPNTYVCICNVVLTFYHYFHLWCDVVFLPPQGGVYNLVDEHGTVDRTKVLKAKHRYALLVKVKREWEIGRCISNLYEPDKALPGYMATGEGVVNEKGNFIGADKSTSVL